MAMVAVIILIFVSERTNKRQHHQGERFSGKSVEWTDVKVEIVSTTANASSSYITEMGAELFQIVGSVFTTVKSVTNNYLSTLGPNSGRDQLLFILSQKDSVPQWGPDLCFWLYCVGRCGRGRGLGGLVGLQAGVDTMCVFITAELAVPGTKLFERGGGGIRGEMEEMCRLCFGCDVWGAVSGCRTSVFPRSLSLLVWWVTAWGGAVAGALRRGRPPDAAHCSSRAGIQQCRSFVEMCIVSSSKSITSVRMWSGDCVRELPSSSSALSSCLSRPALLHRR
jgi:hypothetical protein